ncbi:hypothetical protein H632_c1088p1, partial [Helicosporidium sp. ATCC 50920]
MARRTTPVALLALIFSCLAIQALASRSLSDTNAWKNDDDDDKREEKLNVRPIIGVVAQSGRPAPEGHTYIAASYIKFVESAGARVIPILPDMPPAEVKRRFQAINGVLIPGGSQNLRPGNDFFDTVDLLFNLTLAANDAGDFFPMHGTCLGFEALAVAASRNHSILTHFDAEDLPSALFPTDLAQKSDFFSVLPKKVYKNLITKPYAMENHENGVAWTAVDENPGLKDMFDVLTLSVDRGGRIYVSTMEAKKYPISATQWHPEKNAFEWNREKHIPHDPDAIVVTQEIANYFVNEARKNFHAPDNEEDENKMVIYNFRSSFTG